MKIMRLILLLVFMLMASNANAANLYVDYLPAEAGSGWDGINGHEYTGSPGVGVGYLTAEAAELARAKGDLVYLRDGLYQEAWGGTDRLPDGQAAYKLNTAVNGTSWDPGEFNLLASYPGEWAIIDLQGAAYGVGLGSDAWNGGAQALTYWKFQRLEIINGGFAGLAINKGPADIQYCVFDNNQQSSGGANNPGAIRSLRPEGWIIKYNYFYNNGCIDDPDNNCAQSVFFADYLYPFNTFDPDNCNKKNEVAYNFFDTSGEISVAIKDKAPQNLALGGETGAITDRTYETYGNKIHHNVIKNHRIAVMSRQYFQQIFKNISDGGSLTGEDGSTTRAVYGVCTYNNTVLNNYISVCIANNLSYPDIKLEFFAQNNIVSNFGTAEYSPSIGIATMQCFGAVCDAGTSTYSWVDTSVDFNLIYQPLTPTQHFGLPASFSDKISLWISTGDYNIARSTTNFTTNNNGLFKGTSGTDQYKIVPGFPVGGATASTAGSEIDHPYLPGVKLPKYLGAVNPDDDLWPDGVSNLGRTYSKAKDPSTDPIWIEGAAPATPGTITMVNSGLTTVVNSGLTTQQ